MKQELGVLTGIGAVIGVGIGEFGGKAVTSIDRDVERREACEGGAHQNRHFRCCLHIPRFTL